MKKYLIVIVIVFLNSCLSIHETLESETGCCKITVYSDAVKYEADNYHTTEWYDNEVVKDEIINSYMEFCYHNH